MSVSPEIRILRRSRPGLGMAPPATTLMRMPVAARYDQVAEFYIDEVGDQLADPIVSRGSRSVVGRVADNYRVTEYFRHYYV
jgi:hypothetical protein